MLEYAQEFMQMNLHDFLKIKICSWILISLKIHSDRQSCHTSVMFFLFKHSGSRKNGQYNNIQQYSMSKTHLRDPDK